MIKEILTISNPTGLHARPAGRFCEEAQKFKSNITIRRMDDEQTLNGKSVIHILTGKFACGSKVELACNGDDEVEAMDTLKSLLSTISD